MLLTCLESSPCQAAQNIQWMLIRMVGWQRKLLGISVVFKCLFLNAPSLSLELIWVVTKPTENIEKSKKVRHVYIECDYVHCVYQYVKLIPCSFIFCMLNVCVFFDRQNYISYSKSVDILQQLVTTSGYHIVFV